MRRIAGLGPAMRRWRRPVAKYVPWVVRVARLTLRGVSSRGEDGLYRIPTKGLYARRSAKVAFARRDPVAPSLIELQPNRHLIPRATHPRAKEKRTNDGWSAAGPLNWHFQFEPGLRFLFLFRDLDPNFLAQGVEVAEQTFERVPTKCPRKSLDTSGCARPSNDAPWLGSGPSIDRAAIAITRSALMACSAALGRPISANTLPLLFVTLILFFIFALQPRRLESSKAVYERFKATLRCRPERPSQVSFARRDERTSPPSLFELRRDSLRAAGLPSRSPGRAKAVGGDGFEPPTSRCKRQDRNSNH